MNEVYVAVASWEPRFLLGVQQSIKKFAPIKVFIVYSTRSQSRTARSREAVEKLCRESGVEFFQSAIDFDSQVNIFRRVTEVFGDDLAGKKLYFDISTSPRDVSIIMARFFAQRFGSLSFIYYPAEAYGNWLSKEAGAPKIIVGASGVMYPDKPTCVVALCANSIERVEQIYSHFESSKMLLFWEEQRARFGAQEPLSEEIKAISKEIEFRQTDFSLENCDIILGLIKEIAADYNVIVMTTGPKIGMVHVLNLMASFPEIAAAYIPSKFYNDHYSTGIAEPTVISFPLVC